jgi:hypothetical protein
MHPSRLINVCRSAGSSGVDRELSEASLHTQVEEHAIRT